MQDKENIIEKYQFKIIAFSAILVLIIGTYFYHIVEKLSWLNAWYLSVITLATVGYGDITPKTDIGKLFTTFYVLVGIGIIVTFTSALVKRAGKRREEKIKEKLNKS
jgi:voltage-gated potassium channel